MAGKKTAARGTRKTKIRVRKVSKTARSAGSLIALPRAPKRAPAKKRASRKAPRTFAPIARDGDAYLVQSHQIVMILDAAGGVLDEVSLASSRAAYAEARQLADQFSRANGSPVVRSADGRGTVFTVGDRSVVVVPAPKTRRANSAAAPRAPRKNPLTGAIRAPRKNPAKRNHHLQAGDLVALGGLRGVIKSALDGDKYVVQFSDGSREVVAGFKLTAR